MTDARFPSIAAHPRFGFYPHCNRFASDYAPKRAAARVARPQVGPRESVRELLADGLKDAHPRLLLDALRFYGNSEPQETGHFYFAQTGHSHFAATLVEGHLDAKARQAYVFTQCNGEEG